LDERRDRPTQSKAHSQGVKNVGYQLSVVGPCFHVFLVELGQVKHQIVHEHLASPEFLDQAQIEYIEREYLNHLAELDDGLLLLLWVEQLLLLVREDCKNVDHQGTHMLEREEPLLPHRVFAHRPLRPDNISHGKDTPPGVVFHLPVYSFEDKPVFVQP